MADKKKELLLTKDSITMNFDLTEKGQERRPENLSRVEVEIYERANDAPVFVVYERNDSPQRYTSAQREAIIDWAIEQFELGPAEINLYEKGRDAELYHPVRVYSTGHYGKKKTFTIETKADDTDIPKRELAGIIGYRDFNEPDLGPQVQPGPRIERPDPINELQMPPSPPGSGNDHPIDR